MVYFAVESGSQMSILLARFSVSDARLILTHMCTWLVKIDNWKEEIHATDFQTSRSKNHQGSLKMDRFTADWVHDVRAMPPVFLSGANLRSHLTRYVVTTTLCVGGLFQASCGLWFVFELPFSLRVQAEESEEDEGPAGGLLEREGWCARPYGLDILESPVNPVFRAFPREFSFDRTRTYLPHHFHRCWELSHLEHPRDWNDRNRGLFSASAFGPIEQMNGPRGFFNPSTSEFGKQFFKEVSGKLICQLCWNQRE